MEHDEDTMLAADHIVDVGPGAGEYGGEIVAQGTAQQIMKNKNPSPVHILAEGLKYRFRRSAESLPAG